MPQVASVSGCSIVIHTRDEVRFPPHVHVKKGGKDVVVNLLTLEPYGEVHFRLPTTVQKYLRNRRGELLEIRDQYHGDDD